jgi:ABC-type amino acid transport substrate-binding protein
VSVRRRDVLAGLAALGAAGPARGQIQVGAPWEDIVAAGRLRIAYYDDLAPYAFTADGGRRGIDVDIADAIGARLGLTVEHVPMGADETIDDDLRNAIWKGPRIGGSGVANVMLHVPVDRGLKVPIDMHNPRNELVYFFGPYHVERFAVAVDPERVPADATLAVFQYEPVGVELDSLPDFFLSSAFGGRLRANVRRFRYVEEGLAAFLAGEVAGFMAMRSQLDHALAGRETTLRVQDMPLPGLTKPSWEIGLAAHTNYRRIGYEVGDAVTALVRDGTIPAIFAAYGVTYEKPPYL